MRHVKAKEEAFNQLQDRVIAILTASVMIGVVLAACGLKPALAASSREPAVLSCQTDMECVQETGKEF